MTWVRSVSFAASVLALAAAVACGRASAPAPQATADAAARKGLPPLDTEPPARLKVVALGDSITAGLGVYQIEAYPALLQQKLETEGYPWEVVNAGESGDTSATALRRVDGLLDSTVRVLIIAVGGNDALRGLAPKATHDNIAGIIQKAQAKGVDVLLAGMEAPPNLGEDYVVAFRSTFSALRREYPDMKVLPFLLAGVAGDPNLNQADGIHPTAAGQQIIANLLYDVLKPMVDDVVNRSSGGD
jgi:acyl-CoA thioesterase-1